MSYKVGFDNEKYIKMQSEHIAERINSFGDKLYLELGGKLFDDVFMVHTSPEYKVLNGAVGCIAKEIIYKGILT